jgi:hypothetical protein
MSLCEPGRLPAPVSFGVSNILLSMVLVALPFLANRQLPCLPERQWV